MSFFDITYTNVVNQLLPPQKRLPVWLGWMSSLVSPIQYLRDLFLGDYKNGINALPYNSATTYAKGSITLYTDKSVYECLISGTNSTNVPGIDTAHWFKRQDIFIGTDERLMYNSQIIVLEYALNNYFRVSPAAANQIYINNTSVSSPFLMGNTGPNSSNMTNNSAFATSFMVNSPSFTSSTSQFTVFVPNAVLATLATLSPDQIKIVRQFVDKYKLAGIQYSVIGY